MVRLFSRIFASLPRNAALGLGRNLGRLAWTLSQRDRNRALQHLALAFPELSPKEHRRIAKQAFLHQGMNAAELLHLLRRDAREVLPYMEVEGWENMEAAKTAGRPILLLTGHCGNWEVIAVPARERGIPLAAIARAADDTRLQQIVKEIREHLGSITIERGTRKSARQLLEVLRGDGAIAMLIDQDTKVDGVWVPFFGRPAFTPVGPAEMALKQNMQVIPAFIERRPDGGHLLRFRPVLDLPGDPQGATARMTAEIEEQVRRRPEQWVWWHKRWRRRPPEGV